MLVSLYYPSLILYGCAWIYTKNDKWSLHVSNRNKMKHNNVSVEMWTEIRSQTKLRTRMYRKLQVFNSKMFLLFDFNICVYQSMCLIDSHVFVKGSLTNLGLKRYYLGQPWICLEFSVRNNDMTHNYHRECFNMLPLMFFTSRRDIDIWFHTFSRSANFT